MTSKGQEPRYRLQGMLGATAKPTSPMVAPAGYQEAWLCFQHIWEPQRIVSRGVTWSDMCLKVHLAAMWGNPQSSE